VRRSKETLSAGRQGNNIKTQENGNLQEVQVGNRNEPSGVQVQTLITSGCHVVATSGSSGLLIVVVPKRDRDSEYKGKDCSVSPHRDLSWEPLPSHKTMQHGC
jgi:hypothetical protein